MCPVEWRLSEGGVVEQQAAEPQAKRQHAAESKVKLMREHLGKDKFPS